MSEPIWNCGQCEHCEGFRMAMDSAAFACTLAEKPFVVPQRVKFWRDNGAADGEVIAEFHRIPLACPLPDADAQKRDADNILARQKHRIVCRTDQMRAVEELY